MGIGSNKRFVLSSKALLKLIVTSPLPDKSTELDTVKPVKPSTWDLNLMNQVQPSWALPSVHTNGLTPVILSTLSAINEADASNVKSYFESAT